MVCDGMENNCSAVARSGQRMVAARAVIFRKKVGRLFVNRNENIVPLHCKNEGGLRATLILKYAKINSNNCYH